MEHAIKIIVFVCELSVEILVVHSVILVHPSDNLSISLLVLAQNFSLSFFFLFLLFDVFDYDSSLVVLGFTLILQPFDLLVNMIFLPLDFNGALSYEVLKHGVPEIHKDRAEGRQVLLHLFCLFFGQKVR